MALAKVSSAAVLGLDAFPVEVEVDIANGLPAFNIVGLPDKAIEESKERVRSAIKNSGADFPAKRITVNLAPADIKKEGPAYDLAIAIGILIADGQLPELKPQVLLIGELALNGALRHINGVLPIASGLNKKFSEIILPQLNAEEATLVPEIKILPAENLRELLFHLKKEKLLSYHNKSISVNPNFNYEFDLSDIKGQEQAKRALEIAAAGGHNLLFNGPPGSGKTLLARTIPSILPQLTSNEILEVTKIYSVAGLLNTEKPIILERPFRAPHHTTSSVALVGGGTYPKPGEITLAHRGVLFMDEFAEFPRSVLEALRQPLEDGIISVSRAQGSLTFPAKFILVAAQNPCPCGYWGDDKKNCICSPNQIMRYIKRVSGPILDRIDIHVTVPRVSFEKLEGQSASESSKSVRLRVEKARAIQINRAKKINAELNPKDIKKFCQMTDSAKKLLAQAMNQYDLSARQYTRILKVSRTIADLNESENLEQAHLAEALQYRPKEKKTY